ncbi:solute carrier family 22 member 21-like [Homarus americanus]|uniref:solute carrier family 22 member 21-like n=1 Tax=Homarus americanus TaxID=6706 RepID=UPI001C45CA57|nr:solute carrier family 22 member 21-like [Homarus americanus]
MTLSGVMEAPACLAFPLVNRVGRKAIIICCSLFTGACLLITPFLPAGIDWLEVTLVMLGKMAVNAAFTVIIYFTTELFPTEVRVRGLGTSLMVSRIATMLAPIIVEYLVLVYSRLPSVVFGTATLVTGLVTFNLPETLGVALSDTISHLEKEHQQRVDDELKKPEI